MADQSDGLRRMGSISEVVLIIIEFNRNETVNDDQTYARRRISLIDARFQVF